MAKALARGKLGALFYAVWVRDVEISLMRGDWCRIDQIAVGYELLASVTHLVKKMRKRIVTARYFVFFTFLAASLGVINMVHHPATAADNHPTNRLEEFIIRGASLEAYTEAAIATGSNMPDARFLSTYRDVR